MPASAKDPRGATRYCLHVLLLALLFFVAVLPTTESARVSVNDARQQPLQYDEGGIGGAADMRFAQAQMGASAPFDDDEGEDDEDEADADGEADEEEEEEEEEADDDERKAKLPRMTKNMKAAEADRILNGLDIKSQMDKMDKAVDNSPEARFDKAEKRLPAGIIEDKVLEKIDDKQSAEVPPGVPGSRAIPTTQMTTAEIRVAEEELASMFSGVLGSVVTNVLTQNPDVVRRMMNRKGQL